MLCRLLWCMRRGGFIRCTSSHCLMISNNRKKNRNRPRLPWHKMRKRNDCCRCQHWLNAYQSGCCFAFNSSGARFVMCMHRLYSYVETSRDERQRANVWKHIIVHKIFIQSSHWILFRIMFELPLKLISMFSSHSPFRILIRIECDFIICFVHFWNKISRQRDKRLLCAEHCDSCIHSRSLFFAKLVAFIESSMNVTQWRWKFMRLIFCYSSPCPPARPPPTHIHKAHAIRIS